jgi:NAD(P)-dependent dehydrogenase (short-subunit alcohol dehydrogenase family)
VDIKLEVVVVPVFDVAKTATYTHVLVLGGSSGIGLETAWRARAVVGLADVAALAVPDDQHRCHRRDLRHRRRPAAHLRLRRIT